MFEHLRRSSVQPGRNKGQPRGMLCSRSGRCCSAGGARAVRSKNSACKRLRGNVRAVHSEHPQNDRFHCQSRHGTVHSDSLAWCVGLAPCVRWNIETAMGVHRVCEFVGRVRCGRQAAGANSGPGCLDKAGGVGVHAGRRTFGARVSVDRAPRGECHSNQFTAPSRCMPPLPIPT